MLLKNVFYFELIWRKKASEHGFVIEMRWLVKVYILCFVWDRRDRSRL